MPKRRSPYTSSSAYLLLSSSLPPSLPASLVCTYMRYLPVQCAHCLPHACIIYSHYARGRVRTELTCTYLYVHAYVAPRNVLRYEFYARWTIRLLSIDTLRSRYSLNNKPDQINNRQFLFAECNYVIITQTMKIYDVYTCSERSAPEYNMRRHVIYDCSVGARFHASPPARWKIRKSHSGSLDNPAVLMFPAYPVDTYPPPATPRFFFRPLASPPSLFSLPASSFELSVFSLSWPYTSTFSDDPEGAPTRLHPRARGDAHRAKAERRDGKPALNPDIWCAAVTCKSGQSPVPLRFQIFKVCLDSRQAVTRSLEDCARAISEDRFAVSVVGSRKITHFNMRKIQFNNSIFLSINWMNITLLYIYQYYLCKLI